MRLLSTRTEYSVLSAPVEIFYDYESQREAVNESRSVSVHALWALLRVWDGMDTGVNSREILND